MNAASFVQEIDFKIDKVSTQLILETPFSKEIRILLKQGQIMKEHKAPLPIIVHILEGEIDFGVEGKVYHLLKGAILTLDSNVPHDLTAKADSIVRLTLSKLDHAQRVAQVISSSQQ